MYFYETCPSCKEYQGLEVWIEDPDFDGATEQYEVECSECKAKSIMTVEINVNTSAKLIPVVKKQEDECFRPPAGQMMIDGTEVNYENN